MVFVEGLAILDLGCGSGKDVYLLSQFVGEHGSVVGVDMTDEQLAVARAHEDWHRERFGYKASNVRFLKGYIEQLDKLDLPDNSFDIIISNCVINLSPDKEAVLKQAYRLLKPGGELYFSDVYADRRVPRALREDKVLWGECLSGALYWRDFLHLSKAAGFRDPRLVSWSPISISNPKIEELVGHILFSSASYRLFKLPSMDADSEDYGQAVIYKGTVAYAPREFTLDAHHTMITGKVIYTLSILHLFTLYLTIALYRSFQCAATPIGC